MAINNIHWNVKDYGTNHPLSEVQIQQLAQSFGLPRGVIEELGPSLAHALNPLTQPRSLRKFLASEKRGIAEFEKAMAEIHSSEYKLESAISRLKKVQFFDPDRPKGAEFRSDALSQDLRECFARLQKIRKLLTENARLGTKAGFQGVADKRLEKDDRRILVCTAVLRVWDGCGRSLTFTTDHETSERSGVLINFVNAVVAMVTTPAACLNGETLRVEIDRCRTLFQRERDLQQRQS